MTPAEIEGLANALTTALKRSGLAAAQTTRAPSTGFPNRAEKADKKNNGILFSTAAAVKSLGSMADLASTSLRDLTKTAALSTIGLSRFASALDGSSKAANRGRVAGRSTGLSRAKPAIDQAELEAAMSRAASSLAAANNAENRALNARITKLTRELEVADKRTKRLQAKQAKAAEQPAAAKPQPPASSSLPISTAPASAQEPPAKPEELRKSQLEWLTAPEFFKDRVLDPIARDLDSKIRSRAKAYSQFEQDQVAAEKNRLDAIRHNLAQIAGFMSKSAGIIWNKSIESLDIMFGTLAVRGYGTSDSFTKLAVNAAAAGMSIQEYTDMMDHSMAVVSRSSSFADFDDKLSIGTSALKKLGIVGPEATKAVSSLMTTTTRLGIPQSQLASSIENQIDAFKQLQKTTGLTARDFADMSERLADTASVQTELSALDPVERDSRRAALTHQYAYAKILGVSERAQNEYTQAILEQRRSTVKTRYNQAGRLMQAGSMIGMGASQIEEMRKLSLVRNKDDGQQKRYMDLLGQLGTGIEQVQQQGGPGSQFQMDTVRELLDSNGLGSSMDAAMAIRLGKESGKVGGNADMGRTVSTIDQNLAGLFNWVKGWGSNPIGAGVIALTGALAALAANMKFGIVTQLARPLGTVIGETAGRIIAAAMHGTAHGSIDGANKVPTGPGNPGSTPGNPGSSKWVRGIGIAAGVAETSFAAYSAYDTFSSMNKKEKEEGGPTQETREKKAEAVGNGVLGGLGGIATVAAIALAPFLGAAAPFVAGFALVASALNMFGAGGAAAKLFVSNETATDKNTRVTEKLAKEFNASRQAQDGTNVFDAASLSGLSAAVQRSAVAGSKASAEEIANSFNDPTLSAKENAARREKLKSDAAIMQRADDADAKATRSAASFAAGIPAFPAIQAVGPSATMLASINQANIATPTSVSPARVNPMSPPDKEDAEVVRKTKASEEKESKAADQSAALKEQTAIMQQHTALMQRQIEMTQDVFRTLAVRPTQPDSKFLYQQALR